MKKTIAAIFACFALFVGVPSASAKVTILATDTPDTVTAGGTVTLSLTIDLSTTGAKFFDPDITGGFITLFSGDGQKHTFKIDPAETTETFTWKFTYDEPGSYIPKYRGLVLFSEKFKEFEHEEKCKKKEGCEQEFEIEKVFKHHFVHGDFDDPRVDVAAAAPEISTWAMMLIGFAGIGFTAYRRSRKLLAIA